MICCFSCFVCIVCFSCIVCIHTNNKDKDTKKFLLLFIIHTNKNNDTNYTIQNKDTKIFFFSFFFFSFGSFLWFLFSLFLLLLPPHGNIIHLYMLGFIPTLSQLFLRPVYESIYVILCESPFLKKVTLALSPKTFQYNYFLCPNVAFFHICYRRAIRESPLQIIFYIYEK